MYKKERKRPTVIMEEWCLRIKSDGSVGLAGRVTGHPRFFQEQGINTSSVIDAKNMGDHKIVYTINTDYIITANGIVWWYWNLHPEAYEDLTAEQIANNELKIKVEKVEKTLLDEVLRKKQRLPV